MSQEVCHGKAKEIRSEFKQEAGFVKKRAVQVP
ncbi:hypothetical protein C8R21_1433 [Nitrosospira multiformis]|jgi:hypothetical protein|uniref:Uncharacterized protein n=1 Tax=Nitrosospira multiformis TaxID=1231 RepID=A0A2T5I386_9PROT|nr:hypothetical protein C8R21_1433 [Nitrosospira multiformis]